MSLLFTERSHQRVVIPRDAAIDDLVTWSVMAWVYPVTISVPDRVDIFKKAHAKRVGSDNGASIVVKQNYSTGFIQYSGTVFDTADEWYCVCAAIDASRGYIYKGQLDSSVAEISYSETFATQSGGVESDVADSGGQPGDVIIGNECGRFNFERGFPGRIATVRWWSAALTLAEFRNEQFSAFAVRAANLEGAYELGFGGRERVFDLSGKQRHGTVVGA
jgi:hypothetical protein